MISVSGKHWEEINVNKRIIEKVKIDNDFSENISKLIKELKIDSEEFFHSIKEESVKDQLIKLTTDAFEKEVFGTPTFIVNNKIFWGQDRLEYALEEFNAN